MPTKRVRPKPDITLQEARLVAARGMVDLDGLRKEIRDASVYEKDARGRNVLTNKDSPEMEKAEKAYKRCRRRNEGFMASLAANPAMKPHLACWMIDFNGDEAPPWVGSGKVPSGKELVRSIFAQDGTIAPHVSKWLQKHEFRVSDSGSGPTGWHLGVPCDDTEAERLCRLAHEELRDFVEAQVLTVTLKFWGWRFKSRLTVEEAKKLVETMN